MLAKMVLWNTEIVGDSRVMQMRKKKNYHSESVFMCTKKEQSNFEYKVGSEPSGQETRDDSQETREGSLGEKTFVEDI